MGQPRRWTWRRAVFVTGALVAGAALLRTTATDPRIDTAVLGAVAKKPLAVPVISAGPSGPINSTSAAFSFKATPTPHEYVCRLDTGPFVSCTSPKSYAGLATGPHTFSVASRDNGVTSAAATRNWSVDLTPPVPPVITLAPEDPTFATRAEFAYNHAVAGMTFQCKLDSAAAQPCGSSAEYTKLTLGDHRFEVRAVDLAGNRSEAAAHAWTILENKAFGITGSLSQSLYPGASAPLDLTLSNPYHFPIRVLGLEVSAVAGGTASAACLADVRTSGLSSPTVDIPAGSSRLLSSYLAAGQAWPAGWPRVGLFNDPDRNQDACKGMTFSLDYTGTATKP